MDPITFPVGAGAPRLRTWLRAPSLRRRLGAGGFGVPLALAAVSLIWGSTYLAMRVGIETLPPFLMSGARFTTAGALLYGALRLRGAPSPTAREWWGAARVGVLLLVGGNGLISIAQQWVSSGLSAVVVSTMPLWVAVFTALSAVGRRAGATSRGEWVGLIVGFGGAALLHAGGELRAAHAGGSLVLLGPVCWALGTVHSRRASLPPGPMATAAEMLVGGAVMLALSPLIGERLAAPPSARSLAALAYLVVFGSIVAFSAYTYLLRNTRPAIATSYAYVNPLIAIALGAALGGERPAKATWAAAVVIIAGLALLSRARYRAAA